MRTCVQLVLDWFVQICFALKYIHGLHILHRGTALTNNLTEVLSLTVCLSQATSKIYTYIHKTCAVNQLWFTDSSYAHRYIQLFDNNDDKNDKFNKSYAEAAVAR